MIERQEVKVPEHLYKVISKPDWDASVHARKIKLSAIDKEFIHLATEDQVAKVIKKFWLNTPEIVILKLSPKGLKGTLKKEKNPEGETEYFHLYNGSIPIEAVEDVAVCSPKQLKL